jgi:integrase
MKLTKKMIEVLEVTKARQTFFDDAQTGLALKVSPTGHKAFYFCYRAGKGRGVEKKQIHLGAFPDMTLEQARVKVRQLQGQVFGGQDPAAELKEEKEASSVEAALQVFQDEHIATKLKGATRRSYTSLIKHRLLPHLGKLRVKDVTYSHAAKIHHEMRDVPYLANRALGLMSVFFNWCERAGYRPRGTNPTAGIVKYRENKRLDYMGEAELSAVGNALDRMEKTWHERQAAGRRRPGELRDAITPQSAAILRLLIFTGARKNEILSLKWGYIDFEKGLAHLPDSKTGFKVLQLPGPALEVLKSLPQINEFVFPTEAACGHQVNVKDAWGDVLQQAGLTGWRIHALRHAFASMRVNRGVSLPMIGTILGHSQASTTARYAHVAENPARKAAEAAAAKIAEAWKRQPPGGIIPFQPKRAEGE